MPFLSAGSKSSSSKKSIFAMMVSISWNPSGRFPAMSSVRFIFAGALTKSAFPMYSICSLQSGIIGSQSYQLRNKLLVDIIVY